MNLNLSDLPRKIAMEAMDDIVLSVPGVVKSTSEYIITDKESFASNFGPEAGKNKILKIFNNNPENQYTASEIAELIGIQRPI